MIKILFFIFMFTGAVSAEQPTDPLPESDIKITLPHSSRTRDNLGESLLDFTLNQALERVKSAKIGYDFLEIGDQGVVILRNFSVQFDRPDLKGKVVFKEMTVDAAELIAVFKSKDFVVSSVKLKGASAVLTVGQEQKNIVFKAKIANFEKIRLGTFNKRENEGNNDKFLINSAVLNTVFYSNGNKKYSATAIDADGISIKNRSPHTVAFKSARVDGKTFDGWDALAAAMMKK